MDDSTLAVLEPTSLTDVSSPGEYYSGEDLRSEPKRKTDDKRQKIGYVSLFFHQKRQGDTYP
jgi:hypothetical protein